MCGDEDAQAETESEQRVGYTRFHVRGELDLSLVTFADTALVHALPHHELPSPDPSRPR
ncbi:hypothetical protein OG753_40230 [Streptomyces sp. NBC_00029]|uniref:hypothetical protein n=1 Tax=Streptomyces sp. NBC_00029 TaxID=2903613 RepID=UPI00324C876F